MTGQTWARHFHYSASPRRRKNIFDIGMLKDVSFLFWYQSSQSQNAFHMISQMDIGSLIHSLSLTSHGSSTYKLPTAAFGNNTNMPESTNITSPPSQRPEVYRLYVSIQDDETSRRRRRLFRTYASSEGAKAAAFRWMYKKLAPRPGRPGPTGVVIDTEYASQHGDRCVRYTTPVHTPGKKFSAWTVEEVLYE
jgi:hypothetical protein